MPAYRTPDQVPPRAGRSIRARPVSAAPCQPSSHRTSLRRGRTFCDAWVAIGAKADGIPDSRFRYDLASAPLSRNRAHLSRYRSPAGLISTVRSDVTRCRRCDRMCALFGPPSWMDRHGPAPSPGPAGHRRIRRGPRTVKRPSTRHPGAGNTRAEAQSSSAVSAGEPRLERSPPPGASRRPYQPMPKTRSAATRTRAAASRLP